MRGLHLQDSAVGAEGLGWGVQRVFLQPPDLEQERDLGLGVLARVDRALVQLDELSVPLGLAVQPLERLERRRVPGRKA